MKGEMALADPGNAVEQKPRIWMGGAAEDIVAGSEFHQPSQIHDCHPVGDVANHADIVADEQACQVEPVAQLHEDIQNLRLNGDVQRRHGFITYQYAG